MKRRHPIRATLETALTRFGFLVLPPLPRCMIVALARTFGWMAYLSSRRLNRIGFTNLDIAFHDEKTKPEKKRILRQSYQSFALVLLDAFWFSRDTRARINRWVSFDPSFDVLFHVKPHICVTAHYGNWEVLGMAVTEKGYPLHSVAKPLKNPHVDAMFIEARHKNGQKIVRREGAVRTLLRILQQQGKIALVLDQNTKLSEGGQFVTYFGLPVPVSTAVAGLALKTKADIFVGVLSPQPDGSYRGEHGLEIPIAPFYAMEHDAAVTEITRRITEELEHVIRHQPEHWLWTYKRWKYVPVGDDPERFPFYRRNAV
jgi:KDO2-lipid IV(A) lauroyltransferase